MLIGLDFLNRQCDIIHTDLKPENVLLAPKASVDIDALQNNRREAERAMNRTHAEDRLHDEIIKTMRVGVEKSDYVERIEQEAREHKDEHYPDIDRVYETDTEEERREREQMAAKLKEEAQKQGVLTKIADLGTACFRHYHFSSEVTTRQYRAPEVIIGYPYDTAIDVFSTACIVFELVTGDYLFEPKEDKKGRWNRNEDHLALITELMGPLPDFVIKNSKHAHKYYNFTTNEFLHIKKLDYWPLASVLHEKYNIPKPEADSLASLLNDMLDVNPHTRITAKQALKHPWLTTPAYTQDYQPTQSTQYQHQHQHQHTQPQPQPQYTTHARAPSLEEMKKAAHAVLSAQAGKPISVSRSVSNVAAMASRGSCATPGAQLEL